MGLGQVYQRLYQGNGETFARIILQLFGFDPNTGSLDFKVYKAHPCEKIGLKKQWFNKINHWFEKKLITGCHKSLILET